MYKIKISETAVKQIKKLGQTASKRIFAFLDELASSKNPRERGKSLKGNLCDFWRYRVGDYRIVATIDDGELIVLVVKVGHRKDIYD